MATSNIIDWQIESIRGTVFLNDTLDSNRLEDWLKEIGDNSLMQVNRTPSSFLGVSRSPAGFMRTSWNSNRLDVLLTSEEPRASQTIGSISEASSFCKMYINRIPDISGNVSVSRVAFGLVLTQQISNNEEGLELLKIIIPDIDFPKNTQDFLYRINIPCERDITKRMLINRLSAWSIITPQIVELQIRPDGTQSQQVFSSESMVIKLELDINTDKNVSLDVDISEMLSYFEEFQEIALRISTEGESSLRE